MDPTSIVYDCNTGRPLTTTELAAREDDDTLWLVGNHPDELTGWVPIIAHRTNLAWLELLCVNGRGYFDRTHLQADGSLLLDARCSCFVLPCCHHDLRGVKNAFGTSIPIPIGKDGKQLPRMESYQHWVVSIMDGSQIFDGEFGFVVERESLRIPSTKNVSFIGRKLRLPASMLQVLSDGRLSVILEAVKELQQELADFVSGYSFTSRVSDRDKTLYMLAK